jgi:hypothetical protein
MNTREMVRKVALEAKGPISTREIVTSIWGSYTGFEYKRRIVNGYLKELRDEGLMDRIAGVSHIRTMKKSDFEMAPCTMCSRIKILSSLDSEGQCQSCRDDIEQKVGYGQHIKTSRECNKIDRAFGNYEPNDTIPRKGANLQKHLKIMNMLIGLPIRAIVTTTGKAIHGTCLTVTEDGYLGVQTSNGPAVVNSLKAISIEQWFDGPAPK